MNCRNCRASLSAYLDGELAGTEMLRVREHVGRCQACREELEGFRSLKRALGEMAAPLPPASLEARILGTVREEARRREERVHRNRWRAVAGLAATTAIAYACLAMTKPTLDRAHSADRLDGTTIDLRHDRAYAAGGDPFVGAPVVIPIGR